MKFGKLLQTTSQDMPEMNDLFLRYKQLKKQLKGIQKDQDKDEPAAPSAGAAADDKPAAPPPLEPGDAAAGTSVAQEGEESPSKPSNLSPEEAHFIKTLNEDLARFNSFFIDREEESVIKLQVRWGGSAAGVEPCRPCRCVAGPFLSVVASAVPTAARSIEELTGC